MSLQQSPREDDYLSWAKQRALKDAEKGELKQALDSMVLDLSQNPDFAPNVGLIAQTYRALRENPDLTKPMVIAWINSLDNIFSPAITNVIHKRTPAIEQPADISYKQEAVNKKGEKMKIAWDPDAGENGSYVIEFQDAKGKIVDWEEQEEEPGSIGREKNEQFAPVTGKRDIAEKFFKFALEFFNREEMSIQRVQGLIDGKVYECKVEADYQREYPDEEPVDVFYRDERTVNDIKISVEWQPEGEYSIGRYYRISFFGFPDGKAKEITTPSTQNARRIFEFACARATLSKDKMEVFKATFELAYPHT